MLEHPLIDSLLLHLPGAQVLHRLAPDAQRHANHLELLPGLAGRVVLSSVIRQFTVKPEERFLVNDDCAGKSAKQRY